MAVIPVAHDDVLKSVNLSDLIGKTRITDLLNKHQDSVMLYFEKNVIAATYTNITTGAPSNEESISFNMAYSLMMLHDTIEFLNLNTVGEGIVSSTGIDANKTQLLSVDSIEKQKRSLEIKALRLIKGYLNDAGKKRYSEIAKKKSHGVKASLLYNEDESSGWWV